MSSSHISKDDLSRMWQEAELYEAQGLYDHAILVYQNILAVEQQNRKARAKIVHIQFLKKMEETTASRGSLADDDLSPRLALDLGVAYMGMNLYEEALEEFRKALASSPAFHADLFRYSATCLIRLENLDETRGLWEQILADRTLTLSEKGGIISDIVSGFVEQGFAILAHSLLSKVSEDQKHFIENYEQILDALSSIDDDVSGLQAFVEDAETGKADSEPLAGEAVDRQAEEEVRTPPGPAGEVPVTEIFLNAPVSYSVDNKNWKDGTSSRLSYGWILLNLPEQLEPGTSVALQIFLPFQDGKDPVWVISRVSESEVGQGEETSRVKAQFVSFLPGGEVALKTFIDAALQEPTMLESDDGLSTSVFAELELDAVRSMESDLLPELLEETELLSTEDRSVENEAIPRVERKAPRIRFACECGHVHVIPRRYVGREGKCAKCGNVIKVPDADSRPDSLSEQVIGQTVGGCRLYYKIGGGGMGGVFKGHHIALDIPVAVKVLHAHLADKDPIFVKRFIREARSAAKLQHPNVVGVMNVGMEDGRHFLVMPYVGGGNAATVLARVGRFSVEKVLSVAFDITRALSVAEENNILHRDIKPANILFTEKEEAKLADLGLAKNYLDSQDSGITQTGIACGTPLYFSPEQAKGARNLDIRSDIYSLGITLYHLLNGSPPYHGESAYVIFQKHVHDPLPPFKPMDPPVPDPVFKLLKKMTAKKPENRFANTRELLEALEELRNNLTTPSKPTKKGWLDRLGIKRAR